jgi:hypothetical protein
MEPPTNNPFVLPWVRCQVGWFTDSHNERAFVARCKKWTCVECGPRRQRQFIKRISQHLMKGYFCTFTIAGDGSPSAENIKRVNRSWRTLAQWLKRNAALKHVIWVNEIGAKHGRLHKHAVLECSRFDYHEARDAVVRAGFGEVVNFQPIKFGQGAVNNYVGKYLGKNLAGVEWPRYQRRAQTTIKAEKVESGWVFHKFKLPPWIGEWQELNANDSAQRALFADNMRLEREAQTWTAQLEFPLTLTKEEKLHQPTEVQTDGTVDSESTRGPPDSS